MRVLAIDIGGTKTAAALIEDGSIFLHTAWRSPSSAVEAIELIVDTCAPWADMASVCGVSFGGPFDFAAQTCVRSMHVPGWDGRAISRDLEQALRIPVITDNDANVAALGEYEAAADTAGGPLLYVTISTGVGAAIIANGELMRGAHGLAGELGHLVIGHQKECNCGQTGCLERAVSGYWIEHDHGVPASDYLTNPELRSGWISLLAQGLWSSIVLLDPALIVLGGGMTSQGDRLMEPLRSAITHRARSLNRTPPEVKFGDASGRTVLLGAAILAKEVHSGSR